MLSVGSLCTGYGGLEMGLETVHGDIDLRFVSDIDKDVNTLLAHYHPDTPNLGDLTAVKWQDVEPVDVLCAGYPCQPFSTAGKRKGLEDERAIFEYIADAISVLRPRNILLENVAGHLTLGGTAVIATLTKLGYNSRWGIVRASDTGAPHKRARLFIWAQTSDTTQRYGRPTQHETLQTPTRQTSEPRKPNSAFVTDTHVYGTQSNRTKHRLGRKDKRQFCPNGFFGPYEPAVKQWAQIIGRPVPIPVDDRGVEPVFVEWMMGLPEGHVTGIGLSRKAELQILGNGVVPQQTALAINLLTERGENATSA